jgi:peptidoglycan/LPS O-acetylase OafA/YrhL
MSLVLYRPDIDGLRAIAVFSVLSFHYGVTSMSGGFVGVDVFFVISGYLITKGLAEDIGRNGYSVGPLLVRFYSKRIRRIAPAGLVLLGAILIAGWFVLMPGDYRSTADSAAFSALGAGNIYFYLHTGYFDRNSDLQPLLHMWSLGVEEQFYLAWPLLLTAIMWIGRGRRIFVACVIAALIAVGLTYSVQTVATDPKAAFYLPQSRSWELGAGALLVFLPGIRWRAISELMGIAGLALIGWSVFTLVGDETSPGWPMVPAIFGSALLVWPRSESWTARLLSLPPLRFVGLISYSLYLWHWPLLVLFRFFANGDNPTAIESTALVIVAFVLAYLSWRFVERPVRTSSFRPWSIIGGGIATAAAVCALGVMIVQNAGFASRISPEVEKMRSLDVMWQWDCPASKTFDELAGSYCVFGTPWDDSSTRAILWGDSHAEHMAPMLEAAATGYSASFVLYRACPAAFGEHVRAIRKKKPGYVAACSSSRKNAIKFLHDRPDVNLVVFSASWTGWGGLVSQDGSLSGAPDPYEMISRGLQTLINETAFPGRRFIIIADVPQLHGDPVACAVKSRSGFFRRACAEDEATVSSAQFRTYQGKMYADLQRLAEGRADVAVVLPGDHLCTGTWCKTYLDGEFLYRDHSHIRRNLSEKTKQDYAELIGLTTALKSSEASISNASALSDKGPPAPRLPK